MRPGLRYIAGTMTKTSEHVRSDVERKALVLKPSALGDIAMTLPAVRSIKRGVPGARIYWLVNKGFAGLLEGNPNVDEVIEFDRQTLGRMWYSPAAWGEFWKLVKKLRSEKFDVVMDFQGLLRTALLGRLSGCKARVGMKDAREGATIFYTDKVAKPAGSDHVIDHYSKMVATLRVEAGKPVFEFNVRQEVQNRATQMLKKEGVDGKYAVIVPGASDEAKRWPLDRYAQLAEKLVDEYGLAVVATGSAGEEEIVNRLAKLARIGIVKLAGRTNLPELVAVLKEASLVVGNDTGPTHIAAGLGVPMVVVFGGINPARLYPYGRKECVAAVEPWSRPQGIRSGDARYRVENVTIEMVWERVTEQMKGQTRVGQ
jgi:heptosyltransferase-1